MPTTTGHTKAIRASRVIGTAVKNMSGETIGKIEDVILDKTENRIMFAVVGFGGLFGLGEKFHPLPWSALDYQDDKDAYVVPYDKAQLEAAPTGSIDELTRDDGTRHRDSAYSYYKAKPYWQ